MLSHCGFNLQFPDFDELAYLFIYWSFMFPLLLNDCSYLFPIFFWVIHVFIIELYIFKKINFRHYSFVSYIG